MSTNYTQSWYEKQHQDFSPDGLAWLRSTCAQHGLPLPSRLEFGGKVRIARHGKAGEGRPVYWAQRYDGGHVTINFSTFKHGECKEKFSSFDLVKRERMFNAVKAYSGKPDHKASKEAEVKTSKEAAKEQRRELNRLARYAALIARYDGANEIGTNAYLDRKQVAQWAGAVYGLRYDGADVFIPYQDVQGTQHGLQVILGDGRDYLDKYGNKQPGKLNQGPSKGCFSVIGDPLRTARHVFITEGLATALSVYGAVGGTVLSAISAGNIGQVCRDLRRTYKNLLLTICADNDALDKKTGAARNFNPGLESAHKAALAIKHCDITYPTGLTGADSDFNDLHVAQGLSAVSLQLKDNLCTANPRIAFAKDIRNTRKIPGQRTRYLDRLDLKPGINVVKSPIGTGKTLGLVPYSQNSKSFLHIVHLQSLATDAAARLNLSLYLDTKADELAYQPHLAICINSLYKLYGESGTPAFQFVVIDEIEQLLQALTGAMDNKELIINTLAYILSKAEYVVLLDAHIGQVTYDFIAQVLPDAPINKITNRYEVGAGRTAILHQDEGALLADASAALGRGGRVFLNSNHKTVARRQFDTLQSQYPDKRGLYISGDNSGDADVKRFFSDVNARQADYDYIITTPAANTGISINAKPDGSPQFDFVGAALFADINRHTDALQAMGRVRNTKEIHLYVQKKYGAVPRKRDVIESEWIVGNQEAVGLGIYPAVDMNTGQRRIVDSLYSNLCLDVIENKERSQYRYYENLLRELVLSGYGVSFDSGTAKETKKLSKELEKAEYQDRVTNAAVITEGEAARLDAKNRKTMEETDALERHKLSGFYPNLPLETAIELDKRGAYRAQINRLSYVFLSNTEIADKHKAQANELTADKKAHKARRIFARLIVTTAGKLHKSGLYSKSHADIQAFAEFVITYRATLQAVARIPPDNTLRKNPLKFFGEQLKRHGLGQRAAGKNDKGAYSLDTDSVQTAAAVLEGHVIGHGAALLSFVGG